MKNVILTLLLLCGSVFGATTTPVDLSAKAAANTVVAGPVTGADAVLTKRHLVTADLPAGLGTVTSISTNSGLTGGPITGTGTIGIAPLGIVNSMVSTTAAIDGTKISPIFGSQTVTASAFTGALTGNVTGNVSGSSGSCTGLSALATSLATPRSIYGNNFDGSAALAQVIQSVYGGTGNGFTKFSGPTLTEKVFTLPDASATIVVQGGALGTPLSGLLTNCTFPVLNQNTSGSAGTLSPGRTINGVAFDGSTNITITAAGSTLSDTVPVAKGGTGTATFTLNGLLYGNTTSAVQALPVNATATNKFLTQSSSGVPAWAQIIAGDVPTLNQSTSGNAATATALSTAGTTITLLHGNAAGAPSYGPVVNADVSASAAIDGTKISPIFGSQPISVSAPISSNFGLSMSNGAGDVFTLSNIGGGSLMVLSSSVGVPTITVSGLTGIITATTFTGALSGNASTATTLATSRNINGVSFNGSANITVTAAGSTLSDTVPVSKGGTGLATLTANQLLMGNGTAAVSAVDAANARDGRVLVSQTGGSPYYTSGLDLGDSIVDHNGGYVRFANMTSGTIKITPPTTGALSTSVLTLPIATDTLVGKATTDTLTNKTLTSPTINSPTINKPTIALATNASDTIGNGVTYAGTAGESITIGQLLYIKSDGKFWKAKADATSTMECTAMAIGSVSADAAGTFFLHGVFRNDAWNWTVGGKLYVSAGTGGALTQTKPATAGNQVQIVGYALSADEIYFNPSSTFVEVP